ncbi:zinc-dependent alcohol dehydrogenase [Oceanobacillus jeddahense]|uniref:Alcohol dehydrogenase catalytic domain-containing protein n=1 Tax=Oceanobacillus jeddahense TaxID=1462527 RepID=A0ABY5JVB8_9BACI|nr:alcohol dehydrogenase catalytic domain-containing protein [Oceanobacillus jeddahense]UUI03026.1 alcohol dehydrogenase catalytic domain-containing protein [Oceanobacillus jeddahense]
MEFMKAGQYLGKEKIGLTKIPKPSIFENEARIRVEYAGICGTDMMIYKGKHPRATAPTILGHEFSGTIDEIKSDSSYKVGDKVVVEPTISCGVCPPCQQGQTHICQNLKLIGIDMDGGFAEYVRVPIRNLHRVPKDFPSSLASMAEPLAVAIHTVRRSTLKVGENVSILGAGPIGILIGMVAKMNGAKNVFISDISSYRLEKARQLGLQAINASNKNVVDEVFKRTNNELIDVVFEVAGTQTTMDQMVELIKSQGQIVVVSVFKNNPNINLAAMHFNEISLTTTRCYSRSDFLTALDMMISKEMVRNSLSTIVSHELDIEELAKGFSLMQGSENSLKILIKSE